MMYGLSLFSDCSIELFDITDTMLESIVEDAKFPNSKSTVCETDKYVFICKHKMTTTYFYNKEDRKEKVLGLL